MSAWKTESRRALNQWNAASVLSLATSSEFKSRLLRHGGCLSIDPRGRVSVVQCTVKFDGASKFRMHKMIRWLKTLLKCSKNLLVHFGYPPPLCSLKILLRIGSIAPLTSHFSICRVGCLSCTCNFSEWPITPHYARVFRLWPLILSSNIIFWWNIRSLITNIVIFKENPNGSVGLGPR